MGKKDDENKRYKGKEAMNSDGPRMGKKGFKISKLLRALNTKPHDGKSGRDKK